MTSYHTSTYFDNLNSSTVLPSFEEAFKRKDISMTTSLSDDVVRVGKNKRSLPLRKEHPKKTALKRHLEQEKVLIQPSQPDFHHAKRIRSDWDLLFFSNNDCGDGFPSTVTSVQTTEQRKPRNTDSKRKQSFVVRMKEMKAFFNLLDDKVVHDFIARDRCMQVTDKYLLAMVFVYFKRAEYKLKEYTRRNFFIALYLASDMEEDEEELKYEIFPWALGDKWRDTFPKFLRKRDKLWASIDHKAVVSRRCCEEIFAIEPGHSAWQRHRPEYHGGAVRGYLKDADDDGYPRGPNASPRKCTECDADSLYDSASPDSVSWYVSSGESSYGDVHEEFFEKPLPSTFDMKGLKRTLQEGEWPAVEE